MMGYRNRTGIQNVYMSDSSENIRQKVSQASAHAYPSAVTSVNRRNNGQAAESQLDQRNDEILITLFQQGEEAAFRVLVERYQEKVRNLIYSIFHEPDTVDDLAQEVFIKAYEGLRNFRFQSSFYTWLYRIAVNRCRDEMRKRKIRKWLPLQAMMESRDAEFQDKIRTLPDSTDDREIVARGLQQLPEKFRVAIILKDIEGFSYEQMAEIMQCEIGTVKSRLSRARAMLRQVLKPLLEET
ncbi:MAG: sigma-70 family RNA polymerase sigma factor [Bacteroidota bacterium]